MRLLAGAGAVLALMTVTAAANAVTSPSNLALKPAQIGFGYELMQSTTVAVYQFRGDVLSGVYAWPGKGVRMADVIRVALDAAAASAANLRRATA